MIDQLILWIQQHNWKLTYLLYSIVVCTVLVLFFGRRGKFQSGAHRAAVTWGTIGFALLLFFFLGAADDTKQFLTFFSFGALGAALGYLTGVWLAPSSLSEENRLVKAQSLVMTLLAGAFGTKLLSFWDTLTKGDQNQLIFRPAYYLPLLSCLVGYFVALAAFYTLRSVQEGQVRMTAPPAAFTQWVDTNQKTQTNGIPAGGSIQFAAAADFKDDLSVLWELKPKDKSASSPTLPVGTLSAAGLLTAPDRNWFTANPKALDWVVVATSNRDRSKCATFDIRFIVTEEAR